MRIEDRVRFIFGVIDILISIIGLIINITLHRLSSRSLLLLGICFVYGIAGIINGIETRAKRQKRKEDLYMQAKMLGLLINQEEKKDD